MDVHDYRIKIEATLDGWQLMPEIVFDVVFNYDSKNKEERKRDLMEKCETQASLIWDAECREWRERCTYYRAIITNKHNKVSKLLWLRTHGGWMGKTIMKEEKKPIVQEVAKVQQADITAGKTMRLHEYQHRIIQFCKEHTNVILSVGMGLGKTTSILHYIADTRPSSLVVVAPKRVAETVWKQEAGKWGLDEVEEKMVIVEGTPAKRMAALRDAAHPYKIVSRDNLKDLTGYECELLVIDELTSFKSHDSQRSKSVQSIRAARKIGMTGTFLANGAIDIFGQAKAVGIELCAGNYYAWRATYFKDVLQGSGLQFSKWKLAGTLDDVLKPIEPYTFTLSSEDYLQIPSVSDHVHDVTLSEVERAQYDGLSAFMQLEIGGDAMTFDEQQKFCKLQTLCNGFVYTTNEAGEQVAVRGTCSSKLTEVAVFCERCKAMNEPVLLFYSFKEEALWLMEMLKALGLTYTTPKAKDFLTKWNNGDVDVLMCHPASAGHGLNLQHGGRIIVWSSLTYNYELFAQANARLARQGQTKNVQVHYFVTTNTIEQQQMRALDKKDKEQQQFINKTKQ